MQYLQLLILILFLCMKKEKNCFKYLYPSNSAPVFVIFLKTFEKFPHTAEFIYTERTVFYNYPLQMFFTWCVSVPTFYRSLSFSFCVCSFSFCVRSLSSCVCSSSSCVCSFSFCVCSFSSCVCSFSFLSVLFLLLCVLFLFFVCALSLF